MSEVLKFKKLGKTIASIIFLWMSSYKFRG